VTFFFTVLPPALVEATLEVSSTLPDFLNLTGTPGWWSGLPTESRGYDPSRRTKGWESDARRRTSKAHVGTNASGHPAASAHNR
jgi:hypothetical protein